MLEALTKKITVFIPVRNGEQFIKRAIDSVLSQSLQDFQLVILDNCSTDETRSLVGSYLPDDRICFVERTHDVGMLGNFNDCLDRAETKYYMILCHDDFLCDNKSLERGYQILEAHPDVPVVYCPTLFVDERDKAIMKRNFGVSGLVENNAIAKKAIVSCRNVYGVPLLIRTSSLGPNRYDGFFSNTGDIEFSIAIGKNQKIYYVNNTLVAIRFHKSNSTARLFVSLVPEFLRMAEKNQITLTLTEKIRMKMNDRFIRVKKKIFFYYLDNLQK